MQRIKGDLIELAQTGKFDVIIHGCNCFCTMGSGIAKSIKQNFPAAFKADLETAKGDKEKLGTISYARILIDERELIVINGYTQYNWRGNGRKVDYEAIRKVFRSVKNQFSGLRIGYPAIGAGLAGGDWETISKIIDEELFGEQHTFVEFAKYK